MTDTCLITGPGDGARTLDPTTLEYVDPAPVVIYEGRCRISRRSAGTSTAQSSGGDASWSVGEFPLDLPFDGTEAVAPGQTVTYLTAADDPSLVGRVFGVTEVAYQSQATARRCVMKAATH